MEFIESLITFSMPFGYGNINPGDNTRKLVQGKETPTKMLTIFDLQLEHTHMLGNVTSRNCKHSGCSLSSFFSPSIDVEFFEQEVVDNWEESARGTQSESEQVLTRGVRENCHPEFYGQYIYGWHCGARTR
jgi:hypothetical protein